MDDIKVHVVKYPDRDNLVMRYLDPMTNRHVSRSTRTHRKSEAVKVAAKWEAELQEGRYQKKSRISWSDFRIQHEDEAQATLRPETRKKYDTTFKLVERILNPQKPSQVTTQAVSRWTSQLLAEGRSPATAGLYCRHLRAIMNWAAAIGYVTDAPKVKIPKADNTQRLMKGRAIVLEEHERIIKKVGEVIPANQVDDWESLLTGLWWSGLRLGEALRLSWDIDSEFAVVFINDCAALQIRADGQKSRRSEMAPCAPEFSEILAKTPVSERRGRVFRIDRFDDSGPMTMDRAGRLIKEITEHAGVIADAAKGKHVTAHDYRRAFGTRWAKRVMPATLQRLMRHADIGTTLAFYVDQDTNDINADLWKAYLGNKSGNSVNETPAIPAK